jgi:hypothetical protein
MQENVWNNALDKSRKFFIAHNLPDLAAALPDEVSLGKEVEAVVHNALEAGLSSSFVFPPYRLMQEHTESLVSKLAESPSEALNKEHQYSSPWIQDMKELANCAARQRGEGAYLFLYSSGKFPDQTRNLTADQLDKLFAENKWSGLAAHEYLVLQRISSEANGDHRFDDYVSDVNRSQWMWLLDSRVPKGVMMGYWNPAKKRVEIGWCKANNKNERRGSHPTVVVPLP